MHKDWLKIREELYLHIRGKVETKLGHDKTLARYARRYDEDLKKRRWVSSSLSDLLIEVQRNPVVVVGDFHVNRQSPRMLMRLMTTMIQKGQIDIDKVTLALECVHFKKQRVLNSWIEGSISLELLKKKLNWEKTWGFSWEFYAPLFEFAKFHRIKLLAVNSFVDKKGALSLHARDSFVAKRIKREANASRKVFLLIGDWHLADQHLCREMRRLSLSCLRIFQNDDSAYFKFAKKSLIETVKPDSFGILKGAKNSFCVLNVPPWVKWQNYLLHLESEEGDYAEEFEADEFLVQLYRILQHSLRIKNGFSLDDYKIYSANDDVFYERLSNFFSKSDLKKMDYLIQNGISFYIPEFKAGFLAATSSNQAAVLLTRFLQATLSNRSRSLLNTKTDFYRLVWLEMLSYFGGKLVNPQKKADTYFDVEDRFEKESSKQSREILGFVLKHQLYELAGGRRPIAPRQWSSFLRAAKIMGGINGERLYVGFQRGTLVAKDILRLFSVDVEKSGFDRIYDETLDKIKVLPTSFKSKREKL